MTNLITRLRAGARHALALLVATLVAIPLGAVLGTSPAQAHEGHGETDPFKALVFSKTAGFRHGSIGAGIAAIQGLGAEHGFTVDTTEDGASFTDANLGQYDVVIWLSTTGDVLNADQQAAFERYIQGGGGYAGIHAASDTEYDWPWYGELVGAYFKNHPANQTASVKVEDHAHPSTAGMAPTWARFDEWYNYRSNPRGDVHVLASLDESTYTGGDMGVEHPISWCQDYDGGRAWYTGMGHTDESYADPQFRDHLLGGIRTAAGVLPADCAATLPSSFEKVALDENTANPMELAVAPDGRVIYVDRNGEVRVITTDGGVTTAGEVEVYTGQEFGLLGLALDPDFATNGWVYLYYSPAGSEAVDRVSRFTMEGDTLDPESETEIIEIPVQRDQCCHAGGAMEIDRDGNLYIATGDNTNPFDSSGYNPIDERPGRSAWDAQRTSGNTNSLSGKVLRIAPLGGGGYDVPAGNLFPEGTAQTRPEIYAMGFRNPFRIGLDEQHNRLLVADYGPDAGAADASRGPDGRVEWNILSQPGNYGWPYCVGDNTAYNDYDFSTSLSGPAFNCAAPVNNSPNNTGLTQLPPAISATMWQGKSSTGVPEIGGSGAPMTSGTYDFDPDLASERKWPAYFDGKSIWADWNNSRLFTVQLTEDGTDYTDVNRFLPELPMTRPHALQFGPDGSLYMIEWGSGFGGNNTDSGIYRIDYVQGNRAPVARATATPTSGQAPLDVAFDGSASRDPDGNPITFAWDFDGDGETDSVEETASHTYTEAGDYTARLTVTDDDGRTGVTNLDIVVGNTAPTVELVAPADGGFMEFGDTMRYRVDVTDPEDGEIDCERVVVQPALGHDEHAHGYEQYHGCEGVLPLPGDEGHTGADIFGTITATYTDGGNGAVSALTGQDTIVVHTKHKEAEFFDTTGRVGDETAGDPGVSTEVTGDTAGGGRNASFIERGDWLAWDVMNLTGIDEITLRAASPSEATWEVRTGDPAGPTVATIQVPNTGGWQVYGDFTAEVPAALEHQSGPLYFVQSAGRSNLNWIDFGGAGVTDNRRPLVEASSDVVSGSAPLEVQFSATASDPDGDEPLEYDWDFKDGGTATTAEAAHTYTEPGTYGATVTVTDARGAQESVIVPITVFDEPDTCFTGRSDDFLGTALDTARWDSVVRPNSDLTVSDGQLHIPLTATDIFGANGTATPNIVLQHLPGGAFTITTKLTMAADRQYQQAGLIIYGDDNNYLKMVLQGRSSSPDRAARIFQFASELGGSATETNTPGIGTAYPDTVWVRLTSTNGLDVSASYSKDGLEYTDMPGATRSLAGINEPRVGVFALGNRLTALPLTAHFDHFKITPDDTATPCGEEDTTAPEVDTTVLGEYDGEVTSLVDTPIGGAAELVSEADGDLRSTTAALSLTGLEPGAGYESHLHVGTCDSLGLHYRDDPDGDGVPPNELWPTMPGWTSGPRIVADQAGEAHAEATVPWAPRTDGRALVLHKDGAIVACATLDLTGAGTVVLDASDDTGIETLEYQVDGGEFLSYDAPFVVQEPGAHTVAWRAADQAGNESSGAFTVVVPEPDVEPEAPVVELTTSPATPDGRGGWYTEPVTVTASASGGVGDLSIEYRVDDGEWQPYTAPFVHQVEGVHVVRARATDSEETASEVVALRLKVDRSHPVVRISGISAGERLSVAALREARVSATDGVSGVARQSVTLDGRAVDTPVRLDAVELLTGTHRLVVTVADVAGNTTVQSLRFQVVADYRGGRQLVRRLDTENRVPASLARKLLGQLDLVEAADLRGKLREARQALERFRVLAGRVSDPRAERALKDLARQLERQL